MITDMHKRLLDDANDDLSLYAGTTAVIRHIVDGVGQGHRTVEAAVRDIGARLAEHDKQMNARSRERLARAVDAARNSIGKLRDGVSVGSCGVCAAAIWWNPNEPTGQAAGWRHADQVSAVEYATAHGGTHRATPLIPNDAEPKHKFARDDEPGWCTATLTSGGQCCAGWEDPIHEKTEASA